jgi:hypothetical protein
MPHRRLIKSKMYLKSKMSLAVSDLLTGRTERVFFAQ